MSTALPESFTFALQSRLPANSFVVSWKEFRPDNAPRNGSSYIIQGPSAQSERIRLHLRGAPNEFLLNTNTFLCWSGYSETSQQSAATAGQQDQTFKGSGLANLLAARSPIQNGDQIDYFSGSRESFNSGALPNLDNQDTRRSHVFNRLRSVLARRNSKNEGQCSKFDMEGCIGGTRNCLSGVAGDYFFDPEILYRQSGKRIYPIAESNAVVGQLPTNTYTLLGGGNNYKAQIPLGFYSNLINSHSVIPLGLFSAYSVNGYSIELTTTAETGNLGFSGFFETLQQYPPSAFVNPAGTTFVTWTDFNRVMSDVRIFAPVVQILDPAVMDSILSLYEKREMVNLGGVQFPLSLRLNSLGYRMSSYPIRSGQSDYHFRIAGTDRSVRGLAWWVTQNDYLNIGRTDLAAASYTVAGAISSGYTLRVTRLETKIGNEHIHEVVEDRTPNTDFVDNFLNINMRRSASLWSPLPQYIENKRFDGQNEDALCKYNNANYVFSYADADILNDVKISTSKTGVCYGLISFENMDRREGDHQGSYQASGKDLTNVGGIDISMRFQSSIINSVTVTSGGRPSNAFKENVMTFVPPVTEYEIHFAYCYDQIHEISPSGVAEITNAVL